MVPLHSHKYMPVSLLANCSPTISSLLSMAEAFLGQTPPRIPEAVRCLLAVLAQKPLPRIEARTRLQLGLVLYHHTNNLLEAREHLDKAVRYVYELHNCGSNILNSAR